MGTTKAVLKENQTVTEPIVELWRKICWWVVEWKAKWVRKHFNARSVRIFWTIPQRRCERQRYLVFRKQAAKYVGEFENDLKHGEGTYTWPNGEKYTGGFENDMKHGEGTYTFPDGRKYIGTWRNNERNGKGTNVDSSGGKYVGEFSANVMHGEGTYTFPEGGKYIGTWKNNERNGKGTHMRLDGGKYVGDFVDGEYHSEGIFTAASGSRFVGKYENGKPIAGQGTEYLVDGRRIIFSDNSTLLLSRNGETIRTNLSTNEQLKATRKKQSIRNKRGHLLLQERLIQLRYLSGTADGIVGKKTEAAITNFYIDTKLPVPTSENYQTIIENLDTNLMRASGRCFSEWESNPNFTVCLSLRS